MTVPALAIASIGSAFEKNPNGGSKERAIFQAGVSQHILLPTAEASQSDTSTTGSKFSPTEMIPGNLLPNIIMPPTRNSFLANWRDVRGATGYRIDVSTSASFDSYVNGYHDLDVGQTRSRIITGLRPDTKYYYRARAYSPLASGSDSEIMTATTAITSGLVINPVFDNSITSNPSSAAIQATITQAIAVYQSLLSNPITISILFRYSTTTPMGGLMAGVAQSDSVVYSIPWDTFIGSLKANAMSQNDVMASSSLPFAALSTYIVPSSACGRAIGLDTPPAMFANGTVAGGGPYDGIVTLNSSSALQFSRPVSVGQYDALVAIEHEIDELLGIGSHLNATTPVSGNLRPEDLFTWRAPGTRNVGSDNVRYFSINSGTTDIVDLNQAVGADFGDWLSPPCPQSNPHVQNAFGCTGQSADVAASSPEGVVLDVIGYNFVPPAGVLSNISTRLGVGTDDNVLIGGFVIGGTGLKQLVLRALGPTLAQFGVNGVLQNPVLELHSTGGLITSNDDWAQAGNAQSIPANLRPPNSLESAILTSLDPGSYTAIVRGVNNATGIALLEVYDIDPTTSSQLMNISTRGLVQTDLNVMIAGLIVQSNSEKVIVRALGPTLSQFGVPGVLADPMLELYNANGILISSNNNWKSTQQADIQASGYAPANDLESAIIETLTPGNYTAIVRGVNSTTGVALVEVYTLSIN